MDSTGPDVRTSLDEFVKRLRELVANNVAGSTQFMIRFNDFVRQASEETLAGRTGDRTDVGAMLSRWFDFNLAAYSLVSSQSLALLNGLLSAAQSTLIPKAAPAPAPRVELRLTGRPGERVATSLVIENHFDRPVAVTFESTELIPATGSAVHPAVLSFEPSTLAIPPRSQGIVQVALTITSDFVVGQIYSTTIRLLGFEAKEVRLSVIVLPPADAAPPSAPSREAPGAAKKRRARAAK